MLHPAAYYKSLLYQHCIAYVNSRIETAQNAMNDAQAAANAEGKSSAGDKYETGRAMMQIERDKAAQQLDEAVKLKGLLGNVKSNGTANRVEPGRIVFTQEVNFYIAISAGKVKINDLEFIAIASNAPIAIALINLSEGGNFTFNGKTHTIQKIV